MRRSGPSRSSESDQRKPARRPRALFVGSTRYDLPLPSGLARKWQAVESRLDVRVIGRQGTVAGEDPRFRLIRPRVPGLSGALFYLSLRRVVSTEVRRFRPDVVITQSPFEAFPLLVRNRPPKSPKLVVELHSDWRIASRLYGSPLRRTYAGLADRAAIFALRHADATRTLSPSTATLAQRVTGEPPVASFPAYFDFESFVSQPQRPLPERPAVAWIGVLEGPKAPELLADAWREVVRQAPGVRLVVVGRGSLQPAIDRLVREFPAQVRSVSRLEPPDVARLLDESTALTLSSRSEGFPRVIMEAFLRGRPVVATSVGGIPDLVEPERNGLLVEPGNPGQLAAALLRVLSDRPFAERLADGAREDAQRSQWSPEGYAGALREMVERVLADPR